jgi:predicted HTH transcriptional regulator
MNPEKWTTNQLKSELKKVSTNENNIFEFKKMLPNKKDIKGKNRLRCEFCSFANCHNGYIFFGINDNKSAVGLSEDKEFEPKLSQIVTKNIFPPTIKWGVCNILPLKNKKYIYIIKVEESLYYEKPHFSHENEFGLKIPIRRNGHLDYIKDGRDIRALFFQEDSFYPDYSKHVKAIMQKIKKSTNANISLLEVIMFEKIKDYIKTKPVLTDEEKERSRLLLESLSQIKNLISQLQRTFGSSMIDGGNAYNTAKTNLDSEIDNFLNNLRYL